MKVNYFIPRLPSRYRHGTATQRQEKLNELNRQIFERIVDQFGNSDTCYFLDIKKIIEEFLGKYTNIYLNSSGLGGHGCTKLLMEKEKIKGVRIRIPLDKYFCMDIRTIPILMHEIGHATNYLMHPKYIKNHVKCFLGQLTKKKIWSFYDKRIYKKKYPKTPEQKQAILQSLEIDLNKILERYAPQKRILYLNQLRYTVQSEINSYNIGYDFSKRLNKIHKPIINIKDVYVKDDFMFTEKLNIINKILRETIEKERNNPQTVVQKKNIFLKLFDRLFFYDD